MISYQGCTQISWDLPYIWGKPRKTSARRPSMKTVWSVIASNGVSSLLMSSVGWHSTSRREMEGKMENTGLDTGSGSRDTKSRQFVHHGPPKTTLDSHINSLERDSPRRYAGPLRFYVTTFRGSDCSEWRLHTILKSHGHVSYTVLQFKSFVYCYLRNLWYKFHFCHIYPSWCCTFHKQ